MQFFHFFKYILSYCLIFILSMVFNNNAFSQTPVASYPFNGNANDASGNGNNGILAGEKANPILTADRFGNPNSAYEFGGFYNKNWIRIPNSNSLKFNDQLSISMWFSQCSFAGMNGYGVFIANGYHVILSKAGDGISANPGFDAVTFTDSQNLLQLYFGNTNGHNTPRNFDASASIHCFDNCEWIHYVVVVNNDKLQMYFNGRQVLQQTIKPADFTNANTQDLFIGRMNGGGLIWYPFNGKIDDINIYNVALTQENVKALYGNYNDPLAINNIITIDSLKIKNVACGTTKTASISIYPNQDNAPYQFSINGGTTYQASGIFSNLDSGNYNVRIKTNCNQKDTTLIIATTIETIKNVAICEGQNYLGHTTPGTIVDKFKAINGCDSIVTTYLAIKTNPSVTITASKNPACPGSPATLTAGGAPSYVWGNGLGTSDKITINPHTTTTYSITGTLNGCSGSGTITVNVTPNPVAGFLFSPDTATIVQPMVAFTDHSTGSSPFTWKWLTGNGENFTKQNIEVTYADTGKYKVSLKVQDKNGCVDSTFRYVVVKPDYSIFIPNTFTPNGDKINDTFGPITIGIFNIEMNILDRNGRLVKQINTIAGNWDGSSPSGLAAPQGVYYYNFVGTGYFDVKYYRKGNINLYRDDIQLSPNPVTSSAVLRLNNNFSGEKTISVYNAYGVPIRIFKTSADVTSLDLSSLANGMYILKVNDSAIWMEMKFYRK